LSFLLHGLLSIAYDQDGYLVFLGGNGIAFMQFTSENRLSALPLLHEIRKPLHQHQADRSGLYSSP
jgi:hypothetical protein